MSSSVGPIASESHARILLFAYVERDGKRKWKFMAFQWYNAVKLQIEEAAWSKRKAHDEKESSGIRGFDIISEMV